MGGIGNAGRGRTLAEGGRAFKWTAARRAIFLEVLAATCNVTRAEAAAGACYRGAYKLRDRDAAFAEAWDAAQRAGEAQVEARLNAHALGTGGAPPRDDGAVPDWTAPDAPFDPDLALKVLAMRAGRDRAAATKGVLSRRSKLKRSSVEDLVATLNAKLDILAKQAGRTP